VTIHKTLATDAHIQKVGDPLTSSRGSREVRLRMRPISLRSLVAGALIALLLSGLTLLFGPDFHAAAMAEQSTDGFIYVLNNNLVGSNSITVFSREEDGSVTLSGTSLIGGNGSVAAFADGTQGSLIIAHDEGTRLFAADAGSDQISVVNVHNGHLSLAGVFASHGVGPVSLTYNDGLL
jgi:hypothetical protein